MILRQLDEEQLELLAMLVEAERQLSPAERQHFYVSHTVGGPGVDLIHPALEEQKPRVFMGNIETLARAGLISLTYSDRHAQSFYVTPEGFRTYAEYRRSKSQPQERVEAVVKQYLDSQQFRTRYPTAYAKWQQAEEQLWGSDSQRALTTIGHLTREAMQEFATALVNRFQPLNVEPDKAKTVARVRAVIEMRKQAIGHTTSQLLQTLLEYWGTVSDLAQRQEHGTQREGEELTWEDARRAVFQVAVVMFELDSALTSSARRR